MLVKFTKNQIFDLNQRKSMIYVSNKIHLKHKNSLKRFGSDSWLLKLSINKKKPEIVMKFKGKKLIFSQTRRKSLKY